MRIGVNTHIGIGGQSRRYWTPLNFTLTAVSDTAINLAWTGGIGKVERSTDGINFTEIGSGNNAYSDEGLTAGTLYYYRIKGGVYSRTVFDWTYSLVDADGNAYTFVRIGGQVWMTENLKTTKYNDGSAITRVTDNTAWKNLTTEAFDWYAGNAANKPLYGGIYNGYSIDSGKLAPLKWLIPCSGDFSRLILGLGGITVAGGKLKETGTTYWNPNVGADNSSGFCARGAGFRFATTGVFSNLVQNSFFHGTTISGTGLMNMALNGANDDAVIDGPYDRKFGFSVRCILDTFWGDEVLFDGDSITTGYGASDNAHRWTSLLSAAKYVTETNNAISGTCMQNTVPTNPSGPVAINFRDRVAAYPTRVASQRKSICLAYGINDVGLNFPSYTVETFKNDYREALTILNSKGWEKRQILLISPYFATQDGFDSYTYWGVETPATEVRLRAHVEAVQELSIEFQCQFIDVYQYMKDNGAALLLNEDGLHLNDAGYALIAAYIASKVI